MNFGLVTMILFFASLLGVIFVSAARRKGEVESQFIVTGTVLFVLLVLFYTVGIISGICTIFNFVTRWFF